MTERNINTYVNLIQVLIGVIVFSLFCLAFFFLGGTAAGSIWGIIKLTAKAAAMPLAIYLINFCCFVPRLFFRGRKFLFFLIDTVLVLAVIILSVFFWEVPQNVDMEQLNEQLNGITLTKILVGSILIRILLYMCMIALAIGMRYVIGWYEARRNLEEEQRRNTEAELVWLKNQLNPHFLFNTLNNISSLVKVDADKTQDSICQLSELLRYALYESNAKKVKLRDEAEFMRNYIDLMSLRCNDMTKVEVRFDDFDGNIKVSPLLFISLIENAFKHGVSAHKESFVTVDMGLDGEDLVFSCVNSVAQRQAADYSGSGIGLENMRRRLELLYPGGYEYEQSEEDGQFAVVVRIKDIGSHV